MHSLVSLIKLFSIDRSISPIYGIDIFNSLDQTSNSALSTYLNVASAQLLAYIVLHTGTFLDLPFADDSFGLVTSSLAIHNVANSEEKRRAIRECARVTKPGGWLLIVDLKGNVGLYQRTLRELGWQSVERHWAGMKMMFGFWPCEVLKAQKPQRSS
jgi:ubiquinone/menaquinone biosynthesis C-methylase UbiE